MEDLSAGEKTESSKLPHDVLTNTVRQAGVTLGVPGQREHVLQHPSQAVPAGKYFILRHSGMGIFYEVPKDKREFLYN